jgi:hypothetical protein
LLAAAVGVACVLCVAYLVGWWSGVQFGQPTLGVAWGYALAVLGVLAVPYTWFCLATAGYSLSDVLGALRRPALAAIAMGLCVWLVGQVLGTAAPLVRLVILVPLGALVYGALAWKEVAWLVGQAKQLLEPSALRQ